MIVTAVAVFRDTNHTPITGRWAYDTADPHAITLTFTSDRAGDVPWVFARDLLSAAINGHPSRDGDIRLAVGDTRLWVTLRPPSQRLMVLSCPLSAAAGFLEATVQVCPPCAGRACVDPFCAECGPTRAALDEALAGILEGAL